MRITIASAAAMTALLLASPALAQPRDATAADALFREGRAAVKRGDYQTACPKFAESFRLDPAGGTALNLAQCEDKLGLFASAAQHYQETLDLLSPGDPRIAVAKAGLATAKKRAPKITVRLPADAPSGTVVLRDGVELGEASMGVALPIDPGEHTLVTKAPGYEDHSETVTIAAGEAKESTVAIGEALPEPEPLAPTGANPGEPVTSDVKPSKSTLPYVLGGLGIAALGTGAYFVFQGGSRKEEAEADGHLLDKDGRLLCDAVCAQKTQDSRFSYQMGYGFMFGGGVLVAGAAALMLFAPSTAASKEPEFSVSVSDRAFGAHVRGPW